MKNDFICSAMIIRTEIVQHEIYLLTSGLNHIGHLENTGEDRSLHAASDSRSGSISRTCLSIMHSFSVHPANIAINDISLKLDSLDYISVAYDRGMFLVLEPISQSRI